MVTRQASNTHPAVLCVLGDLFDRPAPAGRPDAKSAVATTDSAGAMIITAAAAERFVLCPSVFRALLPTYLSQRLDASALRGIAPADVPGYATSGADYQKSIAGALRDGQVGYFFDLLLPAGLPPVSYRPGDGRDDIRQAAQAGLQELLSDTDTAMAVVLPSRCGQAGSMPMPDSKLTQIAAGLTPGYISLSGVIEPAAWGVGGQIRFSTTFYASVQYPGTISLTASPPRIDSTIHLEWYAVLIGAIVGAILTALTAITGGATAVAEAAAVGAVAGTVISLTMVQTVLAAFAVNAVTYQLGQVLQDLAAPALPLPGRDRAHGHQRRPRRHDPAIRCRARHAGDPAAAASHRPQPRPADHLQPHGRRPRHPGDRQPVRARLVPLPGLPDHDAGVVHDAGDRPGRAGYLRVDRRRLTATRPIRNAIRA